MTNFAVGDRFVLEGSKVEHVIQKRYLFTVTTCCGNTFPVVNLKPSIGENRACQRCAPMAKMYGLRAR